MNIIKHRKIFVGFSTLLVVISLLIVFVKGLDYSTEFTGGAVMEVSYQDPMPTQDDIKNRLLGAGFEATIQSFDKGSYLIKTRDLSEEERQSIIRSLGEEVTVQRFNSMGPSVGKELQTKSLYALIAVSLGIMFFIAYAFRGVSKPVSSWKYGLVALITLIHDSIIPIGILTFIGTEVDTLYVVGLLSILGLSINDTIVVFDRIRENLEKNEEEGKKEDFKDVVETALKQTFVRSFFTSFSLVVVLAVSYFIGPEATRTLSLVLLLGMIFGTYSSIFLASPLLTYFVEKEQEEETHAQKKKKNQA